MNHIKRQAVAGQVKRFCNRFAQGAGAALGQVIPRQDLLQWVEEEAGDYRERIYSPLQTLSLFIEQVLGADQSCQDAVARGVSGRVTDRIEFAQDNREVVAVEDMNGVSLVDPDVKGLRRAPVSLTISDRKTSIDVLIRGSFAGLLRPVCDDDLVNDYILRVDCEWKWCRFPRVQEDSTSAPEVSLSTVCSLDLAINYAALPTIPENLGVFIRNFGKLIFTVEENKDMVTKHCEEVHSSWPSSLCGLG